MPPSAHTNSAPRRLYYFAAFLLFWLLAISARLIFLQVVQYGDFVQRAQRQQQRTVEVAPKRGIVYDRNGHELAMSVQVDSVFAVPSEIPDQASTASILARVLGAEPNDLLARMKAQRNFAWLARKIDAETSQRIRALNLRGIYFQKESKRFYPKRELGAQVLGYVGLDDEGLAGVERAFDDQLRGNPGRMLVSLDARRKSLGRVEREPEPGENVVLTLDEKIQFIVEKELDQAMQETRAEAGTVVVQNPRTGEILALANRPTFNPNLSRGVTPAMLKNHAVSDVYEPGSTFKVVTIAAALEEKLTKPEEVIDCQMGSIIVNGLRIRDHKAYGMLTVAQVLANSSGVGTIKVGMRLGNERFDHYIRAFGFGSQTGIELPAETRGIHKPVSRWSKVSVGAISMGQEIGVTPLQISSMISTIANDGVWTAPRVVAGVTPPSNAYQTVVYKPEQQRRVLSPLTAAEMKKMMEGVVLFGTGRRALLDGYTSAGKTGTAQKVDPATGAYSRTKYVASFAGFAPVNNPALTIVVIIDSAVGAHQGGIISAPVFARIAQQVLAYMNVPHDAEIKNDPRRALLRASVNDEDLDDSAPDHIGATLEMGDSQPAQPVGGPRAPVLAQAGSAKLVNAAFTPPATRVLASETQIVLPTPSPASPVTTTGTVVLDVEGGTVVPLLVGKSLRSAIETAQRAGIELNIIGSGIAREQSPAPGSRLPAGAKVAVRFTR
ncbi:MAG TPA: penicillin-binding protein [Clostridia bacterium]|nr:penicillin-binding protein [Clostridia bacterium]